MYEESFAENLSLYAVSIHNNNYRRLIDFSELDAVQYDKVSEQTLDSLTEYFDELIEVAEHLQDADVSYGVSFTVFQVRI